MSLMGYNVVAYLLRVERFEIGKNWLLDPLWPQNHEKLSKFRKNCFYRFFQKFVSKINCMCLFDVRKHYQKKSDALVGRRNTFIILHTHYNRFHHFWYFPLNRWQSHHRGFLLATILLVHSDFLRFASR
jgi:hypothetical protein